MRVAAIQFRPDKSQPAQSRDRLHRLIAAAADAGARLIVCPEMALTGYLFDDPFAAARVAEPADGPTAAWLAALSGATGAMIAVGFPEIAGTRLYNAALVADRGHIVAHYRKRCLYELDHTWALPGDLPYPMLPSPAGPITLGICMDLNDDAFTAHVRDSGTRVVAFCTNWLDQGHDIRRYWQHRLAGSNAWLVAANTYGHEQTVTLAADFLGRSAILHAAGVTLAMAPAIGDGFIVADVPDVDSAGR